MIEHPTEEAFFRINIYQSFPVQLQGSSAENPSMDRNAPGDPIPKDEQRKPKIKFIDKRMSPSGGEKS